MNDAYRYGVAIFAVAFIGIGLAIIVVTTVRGGAAFGYVATKQRSTAFAMITMGLGELVSAAALMFMGFFGGDAKGRGC